MEKINDLLNYCDNFQWAQAYVVYIYKQKLLKTLTAARLKLVIKVNIKNYLKTRIKNPNKCCKYKTYVIVII